MTDTTDTSRTMQQDPHLRARIEETLRAFTLQAAEHDQQHAAAVAVVITDEGHGAELPGFPLHAAWSTQAALLLTRRAGHLRKHAGQWALPGGRIDAGETAEQAALRELAEEVHLELDASAILGRLDDFVTRSGFVITPVVVWAGAAQQIRPNPAEVASIHRIPIAEFMRADAPMLADEGHGGHPVLRMPVGNHWIAAPTAAILYQFREVCIEGRPTRVAHFEQPAFAWK
ncbi:MAG: CoA pyrophosphatase [Polaromonas sp.]|uniref:NUDIX hydrolase n=1 Tax=Polaromonas sp. TaxID=1869339 RepID=UPI00273449BA|nr:CoA pyrophosphatase [Polaromonas sp.]MDP3798405.1 CoA pyrophosphatase [Polaromonas sp.]